MRHCIFLFLTLFLFISPIHAATTDTLHIYSPAMDRKIKVNVVVPKDVKPNSPTVYLLHGYSRCGSGRPDCK
jgi:S-formylglutathione hydrolase FrmB